MLLLNARLYAIVDLLVLPKCCKELCRFKLYCKSSVFNWTECGGPGGRSVGVAKTKAKHKKDQNNLGKMKRNNFEIGWRKISWLIAQNYVWLKFCWLTNWQIWVGRKTQRTWQQTFFFKKCKTVCQSPVNLRDWRSFFVNLANIETVIVH